VRKRLHSDKGEPLLVASVSGKVSADEQDAQADGAGVDQQPINGLAGVGSRRADGHRCKRTVDMERVGVGRLVGEGNSCLMTMRNRIFAARVRRLRGNLLQPALTMR
jgi:hypothetical protein